MQRHGMGGRYSPSGLLGRFWIVLATPMYRSAFENHGEISA